MSLSSRRASAIGVGVEWRSSRNGFRFVVLVALGVRNFGRYMPTLSTLADTLHCFLSVKGASTPDRSLSYRRTRLAHLFRQALEPPSFQTSDLLGRTLAILVLGTTNVLVSGVTHGV